ncbi:hypothetical protein ABZ502_02470 [Streptomyces abikoensis]|uniref:hypothetical protein n=1 Tax=Streptomyces abikoensis TaxID=97398 RepID=UPI00340608C0
MLQDITVRELVQRLQTYDDDAVVRLAVSPDFPFAHYLSMLTEGLDDDGRRAVFIGDGGQQSYLPRPVAVALRWTAGTTAPQTRRRTVRATAR